MTTMQIRGRNVGICSWSLGEADAAGLVQALNAVGLAHVQLHVGPYVEGADADVVARSLSEAGVTVTAGMVGFPGEDYTSIDTIRRSGGFLPDALATERVARAIAAGRVARSTFGVGAVSTHAGFLPPLDSPQYAVVQQRIGTVADAYHALGLTLLFETGQESAEHLCRFLDDLKRPNVLANFDPANMILYGAGDPIAAIKLLGRRIGHVHIKDAVGSDRPGQSWGKEVAVGDGVVNWPALLDALDAVGYQGPLVIEREAGPDRLNDIRRAITLLQRCG